MASGNTLATKTARQAQLPSTVYAQFDVRAGGSTPSENFEVLNFDATTQEYADFLVFLPSSYSGGGITITFCWMAASATSGEVVWAAAIRRLQDDTEDIDTSQTYDYNSIGAGATAPSASGEQAYDDLTFTNGADMDSWAAGEWAIVRISRDTADADDDMTGDAQLVSFTIKET